MELSIMNEKLIPHFEAEENSPVSRKINEERISGQQTKFGPDCQEWIAEHPESILYGFLMSFLDVCEMRGIDFDLTYEKFKNVNIGLAELFKGQKNAYDHAANVDIIAKTLAAVLSYIAINEHDFWFRTASYLPQLKAGKGPKRPLWADLFSVAVGKKNQFIDLLPCCKEAVLPGTIFVPDGLTIHMDGVIAEYKKLTGIDLTKHGVTNLFAS